MYITKGKQTDGYHLQYPVLSQIVSAVRIRCEEVRRNGRLHAEDREGGGTEGIVQGWCGVWWEGRIGKRRLLHESPMWCSASSAMVMCNGKFNISPPCNGFEKKTLSQANYFRVLVQVLGPRALKILLSNQAWKSLHEKVLRKPDMFMEKTLETDSMNAGYVCEL